MGFLILATSYSRATFRRTTIGAAAICIEKGVILASMLINFCNKNAQGLLDQNKRRSKASSARSEGRDRNDVENGLAIEAGFEKWLAIARNAGRNPETRARCFTSDLALAEEIAAEEQLLVEAANSWSAAVFLICTRRDNRISPKARNTMLSDIVRATKLAC